MQATEAYWIHNFEVTFYSLVIHWSIPLLSYVFETLCGSNTNTRKPNSRQGQISSFGFLASVFRQIWWNWFVNRPIPLCILIFNWSIVFGTFPMCFAPATGSQSLSTSQRVLTRFWCENAYLLWKRRHSPVQNEEHGFSLRTKQCQLDL